MTNIIFFIAAQPPPSIVVTTPSASFSPQTGKIRQQQIFNQFHNKENIVKTGYTISTPPPDVVKTGYRVGPSTPPPVVVSSQSGILVNPGQLGTGGTTPYPTIINQSHGSTGFQVSSYMCYDIAGVKHNELKLGKKCNLAGQCTVCLKG